MDHQIPIPMRPLSLTALVLVLLSSCNRNHNEVVQEVDHAAVLQQPNDPVEFDTVALESPPIDTSSRTMTQRKAFATAFQEEGCTGHMEYRDGSTRITTYIPERELIDRGEEIREMLPDAYVLAEQTAPRSIACDFENGTSTEHIEMPGTLTVVVRVHDKCSAREPYSVHNFLVWKDSTGGWGTVEN